MISILKTNENSKTESIVTSTALERLPSSVVQKIFPLDDRFA